MTHLRWRGLALIIWLLFAYLITPLLPIEYLIVHSLVLLLVLILPSERISPFALLVGVFIFNIVAYALVRWNGIVLNGPEQHLGQLAAVSASALLARLVRATIQDLDQGLWRLVLDGGLSRVKSWDDLHAQALRELYRGRRYGRPLSLIMLGVDPAVEMGGRRMASGSGLFSSYEASVRVAQIAVDQVRHLDLVAWSYKPRRLIILLAETDYEGAQQFIARFGNIVTQEAGLSILCGIATFPDHALTLDDLYERAENALEQRVVSTDYRLTSLAPQEQRS